MSSTTARPILTLPRPAESAAQEFVRLCKPLVGQKVVIKHRSGADFSGLLESLTAECLRLKDAQITTGKAQARGFPLIIIRANHCQYVHGGVESVA